MMNKCTGKCINQEELQKQREAKQKSLGAKKIALDDITEKFLNNLNHSRITLNVSLDIMADFLGVKQKTITEYEKRRRTPILKTLIGLADFLHVDISKSINYQFFFDKIRPVNLIRRIQYYGLSTAELSAITGYSQSAIQKSVRLKPDASIICLHTIIQALDKESKSLAFREKITKEHRS